MDNTDSPGRSSAENRGLLNVTDGGHTFNGTDSYQDNVERPAPPQDASVENSAIVFGVLQSDVCPTVPHSLILC